MGEAAAGRKLHGEVRQAVPVPVVVGLDDVRMGQGSHSLGLNLKSGPFLRTGVEARADHLEGDRPVQTNLPGPVDHAHAARREFVLNHIAGNGRPIRDGPANGRGRRGHHRQRIGPRRAWCGRRVGEHRLDQVALFGEAQAVLFRRGLLIGAATVGQIEPEEFA